MASRASKLAEICGRFPVDVLLGNSMHPNGRPSAKLRVWLCRSRRKMDASALHGKMAIFFKIPRQILLYYTPILTGVLDSLSESQVK